MTSGKVIYARLFILPGNGLDKNSFEIEYSNSLSLYQFKEKVKEKNQLSLAAIELEVFKVLTIPLYMLDCSL